MGWKSQTLSDDYNGTIVSDVGTKVQRILFGQALLVLLIVHDYNGTIVSYVGTKVQRILFGQANGQGMHSQYA